MGVGIFASSEDQKEVALGRFFVGDANLQVTVTGKAGFEDLSVSCALSVEE